jgi:hypothetical protein
MLIAPSPIMDDFQFSGSRKRRWLELNKVLDAVAQNSSKKNKSSASFSSTKQIEWSELEDIFPIERYVQRIKVLPDENNESLYNQLLVIHKLFGKVISGKEAKRLQFISPILIAVCSMLPDAEISVEEDVKGNLVHANGRFEYVLIYKKKKVCIVEAKRENLEQGQIQGLVGCEVVVEKEMCSSIYAIVTDYIYWVFYKNTDEKIFSEEMSLKFVEGIPDKSSVCEVASKIYGMLSDVEDESLSLLSNQTVTIDVDLITIRGKLLRFYQSNLEQHPALYIMPNQNELFKHCFQIHQHVDAVDRLDPLFEFVERASTLVAMMDEPCRVMKNHIHLPTDACHSSDWETSAWEVEVTFERKYLNEMDDENLGNPNEQHAALRKQFGKPQYSTLQNFEIHPSFIRSIRIQREGKQLVYP